MNHDDLRAEIARRKAGTPLDLPESHEERVLLVLGKYGNGSVEFIAERAKLTPEATMLALDLLGGQVERGGSFWSLRKRGEVILMPPGADMFTSGAEVLVNPVDAATGAQGKGLAKLFALRFPFACRTYRDMASCGVLRAGNVQIYKDPPSGKIIFFAATKQHYRDLSTIAAVTKAATIIRVEMVRSCKLERLKSIAIPALGCGLGGLSWDDVRPLLVAEGEAMAAAGVRVLLYPPHEGEKRGRR